MSENAKLYVGNLSYSTDDSALTGLFSGVGEVVSVNIISDKFSGQSKGFAFVEMANSEDAQAAIEKLNNSELDGRNIKVSEARPQEPRRSFGGGGGGENRRFDRNSDRRGGGGGGGGGGRGRY